MAKCEQGYLCEVCGEEVAGIGESDLYLRYVIGEVAARDLLASPERHIRCNPALAQFIVDDAFPPVPVEGPFDKRHLDDEDVRSREHWVTRGWRHLQELPKPGVPVSDYPLSRSEPADR